MAICTNCVLDNDTPNTNLVFDENGVCNNCKSYANFVKNNILGLTIEQRTKKLDDLVKRIKKAGAGKEYDCILGVSGGVDSAFLALRAKQLGLRPLVVHFDNGWNSALAVKNIENTVSKLNYDLYTYVINWEEFKNLQLSYIRANVVDIEVPTDHFIYATLHEIAYENKIKFILDGNNIETEYWGGSWKWAYSKLDLVNLESIHKKYGRIKLTKYPRLGLFQRFFYTNIIGIRSAYLLNYLPYNKQEVIKSLVSELDWKDPGGKHYESIFTRFYQGYILPHKFGIDKRKAHLSNLIWSGQIKRQDALAILNESPYPKELIESDIAYFIKKLSLTTEEFENIMKQAPVSHENFPTEIKKYRILIPILAIIGAVLNRLLLRKN
ncbi:MAG: N-acetyl sugar amidotransferase [Bacteroidia bacterium]|nr:N-acetyl sugar amidotransferase [Bacteroidia bacterium]